MEAPLKDCTTLEQRAVIRFLNAEGIQAYQICQRMKNIYGGSCLSQKNIYKWVNEFINRGITCTDIERPGRPSVTSTQRTININIHLSSRQRMNSNLYCDILVNKLKPGIRNKRRGKLSKGVLFLHDNARPHTSCKTVSTIIKLGFEVLEHPAYSPDQAPSDYFLFELLKKELKGKRFDSDEDVQKVVQDIFHTLPKSAYKEGIYKLPERWRRFIESQEVIQTVPKRDKHIHLHGQKSQSELVESPNHPGKRGTNWGKKISSLVSPTEKFQVIEGDPHDGPIGFRKFGYFLGESGIPGTIGCSEDLENTRLPALAQCLIVLEHASSCLN
ncbi:hypothetical protein LAZ67_16001348 [Cordylochernes scorpioides]|uniref:Transposase n=1 Tax=Cordylochernes scorpioides TaxID=51811 RepID=A0ABY6LG26_9ARAC|nr:hypothetical protein LAZ67_16001348 [Cordylochernes scorpioides]